MNYYRLYMILLAYNVVICYDAHGHKLCGNYFEKLSILRGTYV